MKYKIIKFEKKNFFQKFEKPNFLYYQMILVHSIYLSLQIKTFFLTDKPNSRNRGGSERPLFGGTCLQEGVTYSLINIFP